MQQKFLICRRCGNIAAAVKESGKPLTCCGETMTVIVPNSTGAAPEKHLPVRTCEGSTVKVKVGAAEHPSLPEHHIEWVSLQSRFGNQRKALKAGEKPEVCFSLCDGDEVEAVYAYCNIHGLWKA